MHAIHTSAFDRSVLATTRIALLMIACCLLGMFPYAVYAQTLTGLTGSVTDSTGAAIPDVAITIRNAETGVEQVTKSNGSGSFTVPGLLPGIYDVTSAKQGFTTSKQTGSGSMSGRCPRSLLYLQSAMRELLWTSLPSQSRSTPMRHPTRRR